MRHRGDVTRVLGVDACPAGWVGVAVRDGYDGAYVAARIDELVAAAHDDGALAVVGVDMPIGLPDAGVREADLLARTMIGTRRASVFATPVRAALAYEEYAEALRVNQERSGAGISRQAFGLRGKLLEVDAWVRGTDQRVVEVHPEVSFAALAGAPLTAGKKTWSGMVHRRDLLATAGIVLPADLGPAGAAGVDDVLDAAAAAWSADRVATGQARCLPQIPQTFSDLLPAAIWY